MDVPTAAHVLKYNLDRYPNGIFFLYFAGRLNSTETQLEDATKSFHKAIAAQREYIQVCVAVLSGTHARADHSHETARSHLLLGSGIGLARDG